MYGVSSQGPYESPRQPHMRFILSLQTMMSSQGPSSKLRGEPDGPFFHDVKPRQPSDAHQLMGSHCSIDREQILQNRMVEPDGIEPTTSCLQSTRSTN